MMSHDSPPVIILGAGPVGLGATLELARFGVRTVLIEKHEGISWHPKTRNFNTRTMEIARGWGPSVYKRLRSIDTPPGWRSPIRFLATATGTEFGVIESKGFEGPGPGLQDRGGFARAYGLEKRRRARPTRRPCGLAQQARTGDGGGAPRGARSDPRAVKRRRRRNRAGSGGAGALGLLALIGHPWPSRQGAYRRRGKPAKARRGG